MENKILPFVFEASQVRVVTIEGEPFFVCSDILDAIESSTTVTAVRSLIEEDLGKEFVTNHPLDTIGGLQQVTLLSEAALTFFVSRSRTELGKRLNVWIHKEVLPQIRKTGGYLRELTSAEMILEQAKQLVKIERKQKELEEKQKLEAQRTNELQERINQHDAELERIFKPDGDYFTIRGYAKLKGISLTTKEANFYGRKASKLSKEKGYKKEKVKDPRYGSVNCYSEHILKQIL